MSLRSTRECACICVRCLFGCLHLQLFATGRVSEFDLRSCTYVYEPRARAQLWVGASADAKISACARVHECPRVRACVCLSNNRVLRYAHARARARGRARAYARAWAWAWAWAWACVCIVCVRGRAPARAVPVPVSVPRPPLFCVCVCGCARACTCVIMGVCAYRMCARVRACVRACFPFIPAPAPARACKGTRVRARCARDLRGGSRAGRQARRLGSKGAGCICRRRPIRRRSRLHGQAAPRQGEARARIPGARGRPAPLPGSCGISPLAGDAPCAEASQPA